MKIGKFIFKNFTYSPQPHNSQDDDVLNLCCTNFSLNRDPYSTIARSYQYYKQLQEFIRERCGELSFKHDSIQLRYNKNKTNNVEITNFERELRKKLFQSNDYELEHNSIEMNFKELSVSHLVGLFLKERFIYIKQCFKDEKIQCEIEMHQKCKNKIIFRSTKDDDILKAKEFIDNIKEYRYVLNPDQLELIKTLYYPFIRKLKGELESEGKENCVIFSDKLFDDRKKVFCCGEKSLVDKISVEIETFFHENTSLENYYENYGIDNIKYLQTVKLTAIKQYCANLDPKTEISFDMNQNRIKIRATPSNQMSLQVLLLDMVNSKLPTQVHDFDDETMFDFLISDDAKENLSQIEKDVGCLIEQKIEFNNLECNDFKKTPVNDDSLTFRKNLFGVHVNIENEDIADFRKAKAVVVASTSNLSHFNESARKVLDKVGPQLNEYIQTALSELDYQFNQFFEGQVHLTKLDLNSNFSHIIHAVVPNNIHDENEIHFYKSCIKSILEICDDNQDIESIAIPLFYKGSFYPDNIIDRTIDALLKSIQEFLSKTSKSLTKLKNIFITDNQYFKKIVDKLKSIHRGPPIYLEIGSIADINQPVDAIVSTINMHLNMSSGTISKEILRKGGDKIQEQLKNNYPNGLNHTSNIAISTAGDLKNVKKIFHVVFEKFSDAKETASRFKENIKKILDEADANKCQSIAIPVIGMPTLRLIKNSINVILKF